MEQGEEVAEAVLLPLREGEAELERQCEREGVPVPKGEGLRVTLPLPEQEVVVEGGPDAEGAMGGDV